MVINLTLTEDHLKLIPFLYQQELNDTQVGVDKDILFNLGSHLLEDMAMILGKMDSVIPNTINDGDGRAFNDETEEYMMGLYTYICDNLLYIESLIHFMVTQGGLTPGTYTCKDNELIWSKID